VILFLCRFLITSGDNPGIPFVSIKLDGSNYHSWSRDVSTTLRSKNKLQFVNGTFPRPPPTSDLFGPWDHCNSIVMSWLVNSLDTPIAPSVCWIDIASEIWHVLCKHYYQGDVFRISDIQEEIYALRQGSLAGNNLSEITQLKSLLDNRFGIKNLGPLRFFLGFEIARSSKGISLNQRKYALDLLQDTGLLASKPISTPMDYSLTLSMAVGSSILDASIYRRLLGRLVYLTNSKPDISFVVSKLSQFLSQPSSIHLQAALHVLRYIKGNPAQVLFFPTQSSLHLTGFSDLGWGAYLDTRRSITGFCFFLGSALVSWKSKKQATISRSSSEAEYRALAQASYEALWLVYLLHDFGISLTR